MFHGRIVCIYSDIACWYHWPMGCVRQKPSQSASPHFVVYGCIPAPSKGCCLNPKGWCIGAPYNPFSTPWKIQVYSYISMSGVLFLAPVMLDWNHNETMARWTWPMWWRKSLESILIERRKSIGRSAQTIMAFCQDPNFSKENEYMSIINRSDREQVNHVFSAEWLNVRSTTYDPMIFKLNYLDTNTP